MVDTNSKRIAKNTIILYIRMLFLMCISLYTSRIVLKTLGVEDYGVYNVVGGVVSMFTMISGSLVAAISRYITYELGKGTLESLKIVFSSSVIIQIITAVIFIFIAETVGLWFLNNYIVIPEGRDLVANWVYQLSIITFAINLISVPFNATIIAHENMNVFAYISILEGVGKLVIAWFIVISPFDRLLFYAILLTTLAVTIRIIYGIYCNKKHAECRGKLIYDSSVLKQIFGFAGWNIIGASSAVCRDQGGNILLNMFFGPTANAARGVAMQVSAAIQGFVANFQMALNPQITKNYAIGNREYMHELVFKGARFSFYILWIISLPVLINVDYILSIWLVDVPNHSNNFLSIIVVFSLIESLSGPLMTSMYATGIIRNYQIVVGGLQLLNLPLSYISLKAGMLPESVFFISVIVSFICLLARLFMLKPLTGLVPIRFIIDVILRVLLVSIVSFIPAYFVNHWIFRESFLSFIISVIVVLLVTSIIVLYMGCNKNERSFIISKIKIKHY